MSKKYSIHQFPDRKSYTFCENIEPNGLAIIFYFKAAKGREKETEKLVKNMEIIIDNTSNSQQ